MSVNGQSTSAAKEKLFYRSFPDAPTISARRHLTGWQKNLLILFLITISLLRLLLRLANARPFFKILPAIRPFFPRHGVIGQAQLLFQDPRQRILLCATGTRDS